MIKQPTRMLDDPSEPAFVRELLQAGAEDQVADYDYNKGLVKHLTIVAAGTLLPLWAKGLVSGSSTTGTVSGLSAKVIAFVVGLPIVTAGVVASIVISNQEPEMSPADSSKSIPAQTPQNNSLTAPLEVSPSEEITTTDPKTSDIESRPRPTAVKEELEPRYSEPTTSRAVRSAPVEDRRNIKRIRPRELSRRKPVDLESGRVSNVAIRPTTEKRKKSHLSVTPVIGRRAVTELRPEQAKKPRVDENPFERETRMLAAANRLLKSDPERSLELAKKGEREFPGSMFTEERRHVLILALIKLSRLDEARQLAGPYLRDYPKSPFAQRVRHALAKAQREE